ncbi:hypothetical protein HDU96_008029 [Phlyctochytrium bullatum]|nr:hypothetical protein HDU96_008029 [Phlyctochytrium bullatum]
MVLPNTLYESLRTRGIPDYDGCGQRRLQHSRIIHIRTHLLQCFKHRANFHRPYWTP